MTNDQRLRSAIVDLVDAIEVPPPAGVPVAVKRESTTSSPALTTDRPTARGVRRRGRGSTRSSDALLLDVSSRVRPSESDSRLPHRIGDRRGWWVGVAAAVVLVLAMVALGPARPGRSVLPASGGVSVSVPRHLPGYLPWRPAQTGFWPLGRIGMAYDFHTDHDWGVFDQPHTLVLADDLRGSRFFDELDIGIEVSPDGRRLATVDQDQVVRIHEVADGRTTAVTVPRRATGSDLVRSRLRWTPDSRRLLVVSAEGGRHDFGRWGRLWEIDTTGALAEVKVGQVRSAAEAPDGRLAVVRPDGSVELADRTGAERPIRLRGPSGVDGGVVDPEPAPGQEWSADAMRADVQLAWAPGGRRLIAVEKNAPIDGRPGWAGTVVSTIEPAGRRTQERRIVGLSCGPRVVALSEEVLLCPSYGGATSDIGWDHGWVTVHLDTAAVRIVGEFPVDVADVSVADDLARTWRFPLDEPWAPPKE